MTPSCPLLNCLSSCSFSVQFNSPSIFFCSCFCMFACLCMHLYKCLCVCSLSAEANLCGHQAPSKVNMQFILLPSWPLCPPHVRRHISCWPPPTTSKLGWLRACRTPVPSCSRDVVYDLCPWVMSLALCGGSLVSCRNSFVSLCSYTRCCLVAQARTAGQHPESSHSSQDGSPVQQSDRQNHAEASSVQQEVKPDEVQANAGEQGVSLTDRQDSLSSRRPKTPRSEIRISLEGATDPAPSPNARSRKIRKGSRSAFISPSHVQPFMCTHHAKHVAWTDSARACFLGSQSMVLTESCV